MDEPETSVALDALVLAAFSVEDYDTSGLPAEDPPDELAVWYDEYDVEHHLEFPGANAPLGVTEDGIGVTATGMGKANAATTVSALCASPKVDLSDAYVLSVGIAGVSPDAGTVGSVFVADHVVDWDRKHRWAERDADGDENPIRLPAFRPRDPVYSLSESLVERAVDAAGTVDLADDPDARSLRDRYPQESASGSPSVEVGTTLCGDEFWHGATFSRQAQWLVEQYDAAPYCTTEMEDYGTATALDRYGLLGRYLSIRSAVNFDQPPPGESVTDSLDEDSGGFAFDVALTNLTRVVTAVLDDLRE